MTHVPEGLLGPSDIAEIAGVSRSAVSNWRRRASDFPEPAAGTAAKPLFSRSEVTAWLVKRGHAVTADHGGTDIWAVLNTARASLPGDDAAELTLSLACARKLSAVAEADRTAGMRWADLAAAGPSEVRERLLCLFAQLDPTGELTSRDVLDRCEVPPAALYRLIDVLGGADLSHLGMAADFVLERLARAQGKMGAEYGFVGSRTSALLARLAAARDGEVLYDPACGIAAALVQAVSEGGHPARVIGHDVNNRVLKMARQRTLLHEVEAEFMQTDVLREDLDPALKADVIIAEPPFALRLDTPTSLTDRRFRFGPPPRASADTAWLQHVIAHLREAGRGYVLTLAGPLFRGGDEQTIRSELVRHGCIEAIVGLPGKMLPHTALPLALWVLRRPAPDPQASQVLFIDAAQEEDPETHAATWLEFPDARQTPRRARVPAADILAADAILSPQRWTAQAEHDPTAISLAYSEGRAAISDTMKALRDASTALREPAKTTTPPILTVGELIDHGVLDLRTGRPADRYDDLPPQIRQRIVTAADVRDGNLHTVGPAEGPDDLPDLTRPGDVLATTMHTVRARVDETGFHLPATGIYRLRILRHNDLLGEYLAFALTGKWNARFQAGSTMQRAPIRELEIPLPPIHDQQSVALALASLRALRVQAARLTEETDKVSNALLEAVRYDAPLESPEHTDKA